MLVFQSHLALKGLVSDCELDKRTWTAGHFFTGLQKKNVCRDASMQFSTFACIKHPRSYFLKKHNLINKLS